MIYGRGFSNVGLRLADREIVSMSRVNKVGVALQLLDLLPAVLVPTNSRLWIWFRYSRGGKTLKCPEVERAGVLRFRRCCDFASAGRLAAFLPGVCFLGD